jgi:hypothetical protein
MSQEPGNVIEFELERRKRGLPLDAEYQNRINQMDKAELLEEMVRYNESRLNQSDGNLKFLVQGRILFRALEVLSSTQDLRCLASSYRREIESEISKKVSESQGLFWRSRPRE